jgi:hypothetical protein
VTFFGDKLDAIAEATRLAQGKAGLALTLDCITATLRNGASARELESIIFEIYAVTEQFEDVEIDLKDKLEIYPMLPSVRDFAFVCLVILLITVIRLLKFPEKQIGLVISSRCSEIFRRDSCD